MARASFCCAETPTTGKTACSMVGKPQTPTWCGFPRRAAMRISSCRLGVRADRISPAKRRSEEHTSELQSRLHLVCRLLLEKKKDKRHTRHTCVITTVNDGPR